MEEKEIINSTLLRVMHDADRAKRIAYKGIEASSVPKEDKALQKRNVLLQRTIFELVMMDAMDGVQRKRYPVYIETLADGFLEAHCIEVAMLHLDNISSALVLYINSWIEEFEKIEEYEVCGRLRLNRDTAKKRFEKSIARLINETRKK